MTNEKLYEAIGDISDKHIKEVKQVRKTKQPVLIKRSAMVACLCLVVIGIFIASDMLNKPDAPEPQQGVTPDTEVFQSENTLETTQSERTNPLVVNEAESIMSADMDVQFSYYNNLSATEWKTVLEEFETATGLDYDDFTAKISDTFVCKSFYSVDVPANTTRSEYTTHDYVFEYQTESSGVATITICSVDEPLIDYFMMCDNPEQSEINGVSVEVYGYQNISFIAHFSYENVNYDIKTNDITLEELQALLKSIIS